MGTIIDQLTLTTRRWGVRHSALRLAVSAARNCLRAANCPPSELDLLVNAGIYRDRNLGEPALAALIQDGIGANPEDPHPGAHGTFSFDVANGTCGVLTALQVTDGFLRSGTARRALVVASDADPGHRLSVGFPFTAVGGALLCRWDDDQPGLGPIHWVNAPDGGNTFRSVVSFSNGHNRLTVTESSTIDSRYAAAAAEAARACLGDTGLAGIDLIVATPARPGFAAALAAALDVGADRIAVAGDERMHTAALIAALRDARATGRIPPGGTALLIAAGAGITAGAARYRWSA